MKPSYLLGDQVSWQVAVTCFVLKISLEGRNLFYFCLIVTEQYEPVYAKWTTERCAICRWVEDWDDNKIIICNRYFHHCSWSLPEVLELLWIYDNFVLTYEASKEEKLITLYALVRCAGAKLQSTKSAMGQRMSRILLLGFVESVKLPILRENVASVQ